MRWASELREAYRELLAQGDRYWRHSIDTARILDEPKAESRDQAAVATYASKLSSNVIDLVKIERELFKAVADVELIGGAGARNEARTFAEAAMGRMITASDEDDWEEKVSEAFRDATDKMIDVARSSLVRVEPPDKRRWFG
jgi:hypothetical protein